MTIQATSSELFNKHAERFFELAENAFGYYPSRDLLRKMLKDGDKTAAKLHTHALRTVHDKVRQQTEITDRIKPDDGDELVKKVNADFLRAALDTSMTLRVFHELESLWKRLCDLGTTPRETAVALRITGGLDDE